MSRRTIIGFAATATLVALIVAGSSMRRGVTHAQSDEVCGNGIVDPGEQCDDGNLTSGDGCSAYCMNEVCGNGILDAGEQCDDGNQIGGDGCGSLCTIEFCGDQIVQSPETCDDGNNVSGDGCSATCQLENTLRGDLLQGDQPAAEDHPAAAPSPDATAPAAQPAAPAIPVRVLQAAVEAAAANTFVRGEEGQDYINYLEPDNQEALKDILRALRDRKPLSKEQRTLADQFAKDLGLSKDAQRDRYNDMLARLIATTISEGVVSESQLDQSKLTGDPTAIADELRKVAQPINTDDLRSRTVDLVSELERQGVSIDGLSTADIANNIAEGKRPVEIFETMVDVKEKVEKAATKDVGATYQQVLENAENLRSVLPVLEREYGIDRAKVEARITELENVARTAGPQQAREVVDAINGLTVSIQRDRKIDKKTLDSIDEQSADKYLQRFAQIVAPTSNSPVTASLVSTGQPGTETKPGDLLKMTETLSRQAPLMQRKAFAGQDVQAQKEALTQYLFSQPDIMRLRATLQEGDHAELDKRELALRDSIDRIGEIDVPDDPCDDSVLAATECVRQHIDWLEGAVRDRNVLSRVGGYLEDAGAVDLFRSYFPQ